LVCGLPTRQARIHGHRNRARSAGRIPRLRAPNEPMRCNCFGREERRSCRVYWRELKRQAS
jgi:hypothetical protein